MPNPIVYIDRSEIRDGKLEEVKAAMKRLAAFIFQNNPHIISYGFFLDEDGTCMTVVGVHPDSSALEFHMDVGDVEFRKFADLVDLSSISIYGDVSDAALERLHRKARMLGRGTVAVHRSHAGFAR
jgi:quinol monooxygenase YgiN